MRALMISADSFEDSELLIPYYRLKEAGVDVAVDTTLDEVNADDYGIPILPGGAL